MSKTTSSAMATVCPGSPTRGFMRMSSISGVSPSVTPACRTGCWYMLTPFAKKSIGGVQNEITQSSCRASPRVARVEFPVGERVQFRQVRRAGRRADHKARRKSTCSNW